MSKLKSKRTLLLVFFFNDTATTEIYTLSLHDALPISVVMVIHQHVLPALQVGQHSTQSIPRGQSHPDRQGVDEQPHHGDRKSTRLNSSHSQISYAVFCLKKKTRHMIMIGLVNTMSICE